MRPYDNVIPQLKIRRRHDPLERSVAETVFYDGNTFTIGAVYFGMHYCSHCIISIIPTKNYLIKADSYHYSTKLNIATLGSRDDMYTDFKDLVYIGNYYDSPEYTMFRNKRM